MKSMHQKFYDFWQLHRLPCGGISNDVVTPKALKPLLTNIVRIRKTPAGPKYTIIGTQVVEEYKQDFKSMHQKFYDFWQLHRLPCGGISNDVVTPKALKPLLTNIVRIRKTPAGPKYTIIGTQVVEEYKQDFTGLLVSEHPHEICRNTYISMIQQMEEQPFLVTCYGRFCYPNRNYLRTMETGFALTFADGTISGYLVLVTVDHTFYMDDMYSPCEPSSVTAHEVHIQNQYDFDRTMALYQGLTA